ncbi:hypothetical protein CASFOL_019673 [Castilleja foliolosa]|uniref:RING-type E3 ubiquitin transferase n=1 Tax=Castilleja foliolosa TaxID=1961234 RepID=A0ABD3D276_9LAMI
MDADYESNLVESSPPHVVSITCAFCRRTLSSDNNNNRDIGDLDVDISVCGNCKFLLLEDLETISPDVYTSRLPVYDTPGSMDSMLFSQQFSQLINLARQNQAGFSEHDYQSVDGDGPARLVPHTSSRTTPSGSRRWRRVFSDTESDGFDSLYGESESNVSFRRYSAYGPDSDASVDDFGRLNIESDLDSDTDIDPMNAGLYRWNSEEEDSEWEEDDIERNTILPRSQFLSPDYSLGIHRRVQVRNYVGESGDYVDAGGLENLLERLAETESSTRGAPPASVSFVNNMPYVTINDDESDSMECAVCKDSFIVGTVVNMLPCFHRFHPSCILPWLSARNTCPLCRHEVPSDDVDYEARKRNRGDGYGARPRDVDYGYDDNVVDEPSGFEHDRERVEIVANEESVGNNGFRRNRWLFLAAPIVGIVGITLMLCFGNPLRDRKFRSGRVSHRRENSSSQRKWWSFF